MVRKLEPSQLLQVHGYRPSTKIARYYPAALRGLHPWNQIGLHSPEVPDEKSLPTLREQELRNAQAIVLAYDGLNPHPPTYCYLKPYYLDKNSSYFEQLAKGEI